MKLKIGEPESDISIRCEDNWQLLRTKFQTINLKGVVFGLLVMILLSFFIKYFTLNGETRFTAYRNLHMLVLLIPIHELCHMLCFPSIKNTTMGFSPRYFVFYVTSGEVITRKRMFIILSMPFIIISLSLIIAMFFIKSELLVYFSLFNALASGADLFMFLHSFNE